MTVAVNMQALEALLTDRERWEARAERHRLAWTSARQRAMNHLLALVESDDEREALRAEVVRLGRELQRAADHQCGCLGTVDLP